MSARERLQRKAEERRERAVTAEDAEREADEVCHNLPGVEAAWAHRCFDFISEHEAFLSSVPRNARGERVHLTSVDSDIHDTFRAAFPSLDVGMITEDGLKNEQAKAQWRAFCNAFEHRVEEWNTATLLRLDPSKGYSPENTTLAPRMQFLAIEIARMREGRCREVMAQEREGAEQEEFFMRKCARCGKEAPFRCTRCKSVRYCSQKCQREDWPSHKPNCS